MSNWEVNLKNMMCQSTISGSEFKIRYDEDKNRVNYFWNTGMNCGWSRCVSEIRDEYLRQRDIEADKLLLGEELE